MAPLPPAFTGHNAPLKVAGTIHKATTNPRASGRATTEVQPTAKLENQVGNELRHGPIYLT
jgi:hypothetical protein